MVTSDETRCFHTIVKPSASERRTEVKRLRQNQNKINTRFQKPEIEMFWIISFHREKGV